MPAAELKVTIGSIIFNDYSTSVPSYILRNTSKLLSTLSTRQTKSDKQGGHGIYDSLSFYQERVLPFEGEILGTSQADRKTKEEALKQVLALSGLQSYAVNNGYQTVLFTDEDGTLKQCSAKIVQPPSIEILGDADPYRRGFTFVMLAQDPLLYSQTLQQPTGKETVIGTNFKFVQSVSPTFPCQFYRNTDASLTCTNSGTADAPPLIIVTGPTANPKITNTTTGVFMYLNGLTLLASERVEIDVSAGTITKYDVSSVASNVSGYLTTDSGWLFLKAGSNPITLIDSSPDTIAAAITVKWRDAWV